MSSTSQVLVPLNQPFTGEAVVKFVATAISLLLNPAAAKPALLAACKAAQLDISESVLDGYIAAAADQVSTAVKGKAGQKVKKEKAPRRLSPFNIFSVKMSQQLRVEDERKGAPAASNYMLQATAKYKQFDAEWKKRFATVYGPLVQRLNEDAVKNHGSGTVEHPKLLAEVAAYEAEHGYAGILDPANPDALIEAPKAHKEKKPKHTHALTPERAATANGTEVPDGTSAKKKKKKRTAEVDEAAAAEQAMEAAVAGGTAVTEEKKKKKKKKHKENGVEGSD